MGVTGDIMDRWQSLSPTEKIIVGVAGGGVAVLGLVALHKKLSGGQGTISANGTFPNFGGTGVQDTGTTSDGGTPGPAGPPGPPGPAGPTGPTGPTGGSGGSSGGSSGGGGPAPTSGTGLAQAAGQTGGGAVWKSNGIGSIDFTKVGINVRPYGTAPSDAQMGYGAVPTAPKAAAWVPSDAGSSVPAGDYTGQATRIVTGMFGQLSSTIPATKSPTPPPKPAGTAIASAVKSTSTASHPLTTAATRSVPASTPHGSRQ